MPISAKPLDSLQNKLTMQIVPSPFPSGQGESFSGIVDILEQKAYAYENGKAKEVDIPADMADDIETYREMLIDAAAEGDDDLMMKYLDGEDLTTDEIVVGLKKWCKKLQRLLLYSADALLRI